VTHPVATINESKSSNNGVLFMINLRNISGYFLLIIAYQCLDDFTLVYMTLKEGGRFSGKAGKRKEEGGKRVINYVVSWWLFQESS
jgi:hypothetical protein